MRRQRTLVAVTSTPSWAGTSRVEGPRERILSILRRRDGVGVDDFAKELGLAGATVRRHLDVLLRDGHIAVSQLRGRTGRPRYVFSITEAGAELFPHHYVRLTHRLLQEIASLEARDTAGRDGAELAGLVFGRMAERLAREHGPRIRGITLEERARRLVESLAEEGLDYEVVLGGEDGNEVWLLGRGCPCGRFGLLPFARSLHEPHVSTCEHDRQLIERLLGASVTPLGASELPHEFLGGYRVLESVEDEPAEEAVAL